MWPKLPDSIIHSRPGLVLNSSKKSFKSGMRSRKILCSMPAVICAKTSAGVTLNDFLIASFTKSWNPNTWLWSPRFCTPPAMTNIGGNELEIKAEQGTLDRNLNAKHALIMKREMELIRQILHKAEVLEFEDGEPYERYCSKTTNEAYQITLMKDAGLVDADIKTIGGGIPCEATIIRLTWTGHDFLDSSRDSKIWKMAMKHVIKPGASWTFSILVEWLKQEARRRVLGVPVGCDSTSSEIV